MIDAKAWGRVVCLLASLHLPLGSYADFPLSLLYVVSWQFSRWAARVCVVRGEWKMSCWRVVWMCLCARTKSTKSPLFCLRFEWKSTESTQKRRNSDIRRTFSPIARIAQSPFGFTFVAALRQLNSIRSKTVCTESVVLTYTMCIALIASFAS